MQLSYIDVIANTGLPTCMGTPGWFFPMIAHNVYFFSYSMHENYGENTDTTCVWKDSMSLYYVLRASITSTAIIY